MTNRYDWRVEFKREIAEYQANLHHQERTDWRTKAYAMHSNFLLYAMWMAEDDGEEDYPRHGTLRPDMVEGRDDLFLIFQYLVMLIEYESEYSNLAHDIHMTVFATSDMYQSWSLFGKTLYQYFSGSEMNPEPNEWAMKEIEELVSWLSLDFFTHTDGLDISISVTPAEWMLANWNSVRSNNE